MTAAAAKALQLKSRALAKEAHLLLQKRLEEEYSQQAQEWLKRNRDSIDQAIADMATQCRDSVEINLPMNDPPKHYKRVVVGRYHSLGYQVVAHRGRLVISW